MALDIKIGETFIYKEGKKLGIKIGKAEGRKIGKDEVIIELLKKAKLSMEVIAEVAKVSLDHVKALAKQVKS